MPVGCSPGGSENRHGEDHDEISTDRPRGGPIAGLTEIKSAQPSCSVRAIHSCSGKELRVGGAIRSRFAKRLSIALFILK